MKRPAIGKIFEQLLYYFIITLKIFCQHGARSNDSKSLTADLLHSLWKLGFFDMKLKQISFPLVLSSIKCFP